MADFGGFELQSAAEIADERKQFSTQRMQSAGNNLHARRVARMQNSIEAIGGQLAVGRRKRETIRLLESQRDALRALGPEATDIDKREARMRASLEVLEEINEPAAALQAQEQLVKIDKERFERSRLLQQDERATEAHEARMQQESDRVTKLKKERDDQILWESKSVKYDKDGKQLGTIDNDDPEFGATQDRLIAEGGMVVPMKQALEMMTDDIAGSNLTKTGQVKKLSEIGNHRSGLAAVNKILEHMIADPEILTSAGGEASLKIDNLSKELAAGVHVAEALAAGTYGVGVFRNGQQFAINDFLNEKGVRRAEMQGLVMNLAYSLAKSLDDGGRLSDQDVEMAITMLGVGDGGSVDPIAFRNQVQLLFRDKIERAMDFYPLHNDKSVNAAMIFLQEDLDLLDERFNDFDAAFAKVAPRVSQPAPSRSDELAPGIKAGAKSFLEENAPLATSAFRAVSGLFSGDEEEEETGVFAQSGVRNPDGSFTSIPNTRDPDTLEIVRRPN